MKLFRVYGVFFFLGILLFHVSCKKDKPDEGQNPTTDTNLVGYSILAKLPGIWNGPVSSTTALGSYNEWIVDLRPISENQVSSKNELDELNDIHLSFFIAKYNNKNCLFFRNGGGFAGQKRVSYFQCDSVSETVNQSYYRFSELLKGKKRACTEIIFRSDSLLMKTYTNQYNQLPQAELHMTWSAKLQDLTSAQAAISQFQFPQQTPCKDLSTAFDGQEEAVYYTLASDPYPENQQPFLGQTTIQFTFSPTLTVDNSKNVFLIITTQALINGFSLNQNNMKYRSRYVRVGASAGQFLFNYMHPGAYFVYALYDKDGNNTFSSGDYVSTTNTSFSLAELGTTNASVQMNYEIP